MIDQVVGKLIADKYRVEGLIAERESGDLYFGKNEMLDRPVAIKVLSPALAIDNRWVKAFVNEARSSSAITHPNILNITDFGTDSKGYSYAVYEEVTGRPLSDILSADPLIDEKRALSLSRQMADALSCAHEKNIIHGRLEPRTVFVGANEGEGESVKIFGFGSDPLSVPRDADPRYLAPEQCTAFPAADNRSDVYSLGVMLYEKLSGIVPFDGATAADVLAKQNSEPPAPLSAFRRDLHPDIEPVVLTAIAPDPERRYQTVKAFSEDIDLLLASLGGKDLAKAAGASKRSVWQAAFVVLAGISLLAVALIYATSVRQTDPTEQLQAADLGSLPVQPIGPATGAQEESLARMPALTDAEIMSTAAMQQMQSDLPGGDGYNAWANGGVPPPGAPLNSQAPPLGYVPPGGQVYTIDPSTGSQFMPPDGGVILVPVPVNSNTVPSTSPSPKGSAANTSGTPNPEAASSPKPLATPPPKAEKTPAKPSANKPGPAAQEPKGKGQDSDSSLDQN
jgi:serine/threonine protein kinase